MGVAEDLDQFEQLLRELIIKYEQYFLGIEKREPLRLFSQVERLSQRFLSGGISNAMQRFRYNCLVARFTTYRQYWSRIVRLIEEGKYSRDRFKMKIHERDKNLEPAPQPDPEKPVEREVDRVYQQYLEARAACRLPTEGISPEMIAAAIDKQRPLIMERYHCTGVEFRVVIEEGKPKIKARPVA
jgi:hypothetical protein